MANFQKEGIDGVHMRECSLEKPSKSTRIAAARSIFVPEFYFMRSKYSKCF
jgi:hypothetical protein